MRLSKSLIVSSLATSFWGAVCLPGQDTDRAAKIYSDSSKSVVLLLVKSDAGQVVAQGTGFLLGDGKIITNEHVARAGSLSIDLGAVKIPAKVDQVDIRNDLAVLSTSAELSATALILNPKLPDPGASVYAIGNPAGLERSISTGVVAGIREIEGRQLIQVTAPISPGSSGGPILDTQGRVIGVAVGILESGQNLNFAVPASFVKALLDGNPVGDSSFSSLIEQFDDTYRNFTQLSFSAEPNSPWQKNDREADLLLRKALDRAGNSIEQLLQVVLKAQSQNVDIAISAAEHAVEVKSTAETNLSLGRALQGKATWLNGEEGGPLRERAEKVLRLASQLSKSPIFDISYTLADVLEDRGSKVEAETLFRKSLDLSRASGTVEQQADSLRSLARVAYALKQPTQGDAWFKALVNLDRVSGWDWQAQAKRLDSASNFRDAGKSYIEAAKNGTSWTDWCEAATSLSLVSTETDLMLSSARKCVSEGSGKQNSEDRLGLAHYQIADALNDRGVFQEALSQAKESSVLRPSDPWAFNAQSEALLGLRRFQEAINASNQAIRLSDGKYSTMHFNLGSAYFETENWEFARQSYQKASELDVMNSAAAYNVALCFVRLNYRRDAATWYEEVLRREPTHPKKQEILNSIAALRK